MPFDERSGPPALTGDPKVRLQQSLEAQMPQPIADTEALVLPADRTTTSVSHPFAERVA